MTEEGKIQSKLIKKLEKEGYFVLKLKATNKSGIPDILALKSDEVRFIEVKTEKGIVSALQEYRLKELRKYGFKAEVHRG